MTTDAELRNWIEATVFEDRDHRWVLAFRHGVLVERVDLGKYALRNVGCRETAEAIANDWLSAVGTLHVECPTCGARRGVTCKVGHWKVGRPNRATPHARRLELVQLSKPETGEPTT